MKRQANTGIRPRYTWEEAVRILRDDPRHHDLIYNSYLTTDLLGNCTRFLEGPEFREVLSLLRSHSPAAKRLLDVPGGNGIAAFAFAKSGFEVTSVEPDPSPSVGHAAIAQVLASGGLTAAVVAAFGERLPFSAEAFDVVYVRQGLHHAFDLPGMVSEFARVLRPGGVLLACREHVVDDYARSLKRFLDSQVDHQLYGGEYAYTLPDYRGAIAASGLVLLHEYGPYDTIINMAPRNPEILRRMVLESTPGQLLRRVLPAGSVASIGMWWVRRRRAPGRLTSFLARKPASGQRA